MSKITEAWVSKSVACTICHACEDVAPDLFEVDTTTSHLKKTAEQMDGDDEELYRVAAETCPVAIICFKEKNGPGIPDPTPAQVEGYQGDDNRKDQKARISGKTPLAK